MRIFRVSLVSALLLTFAIGCSANRNKATALPGSLDHGTEPPRHEHEYTPHPDRADDFLNPPPVPSQQQFREPVPAPPALGVSRVKSVSWLKDVGARLNRKPAPCGQDCSDEQIVGKYTAIDACTPDSDHCTADCPEEFCESACEGKTTSKPGPVDRFRKSVSKLLCRRKPGSPDQNGKTPCTLSENCGTPLIHEYSATTSCAPDFPSPKPGCGSASDVDGECLKRQNRTLHNGRNSECLADPLDGTNTESDDPGLITPSNQIEDLTPEPANETLQNSEGPVPAEIPTLPIPESPVPAEPTVPESVNPSSKLVEPPLWPRLRGRGAVTSTSVSREIPTEAKPGPAPESANSIPMVIPMQRK